MEKSKLNLDNLKVESFVTTMANGKDNTVKGGTGHTCPIPYPEFHTTPCNCNTSFGQICYDPR